MKPKYVWILTVENRGYKNPQKNIYSVNRSLLGAMKHYKIVVDYQIKLKMEFISSMAIEKKVERYYTKRGLECPIISTSYRDKDDRDEYEIIKIDRYIVR